MRSYKNPTQLNAIITIFAFLCCALHAALGVECLQYKDSQDESIRYRKLDDKGTITEVGFSYIEDFNLYSGYSIEYQKTDDGLSLIVIGNIFEDFIEFEASQLSPVMASSRSEYLIEHMESGWTEIKIKGREPLVVRWAEIDSEDLMLKQNGN